MKSLRDGALIGKATTTNTGAYPRVDHLRRLLGHDVLMLAWPLGEKGSKKRWGHLSMAKMAEPAYLSTLEAGNIGIALGKQSNGLCSIDWDSEEWMRTFLEFNPALQKSLRTRGARGCNVWVRVIGDYPPPFKIKTTTREAVGEWRANGNQTIICGQHPSGQNYSFIVEAKPVDIAFKDIDWPEGLKVRPADDELSIEHSNSVTHPLSNPGTQETQVVPDAGSVIEISEFIPKQRGETDRLLWAMAGRMKRWENQQARRATTAERRAVFKAWWATANEHVDSSIGYHGYLSKWERDCKQRKFADDETPLTSAWLAALTKPLPPEATAGRGEEPMSKGMQLLVALCYQLQLAQGTKPFHLGSRDAARLLAIPNHTTVFYWIEYLANEDDPIHILKKVRIGSHAARRTNEYLYLPLVAALNHDT